jgi:hypothetical protein
MFTVSQNTNCGTGGNSGNLVSAISQFSLFGIYNLSTTQGVVLFSNLGRPPSLQMTWSAILAFGVSDDQKVKVVIDK